MVTPSCSTATRDMVINDISPWMKLVPRLYIMAIPISRRNRIGVRNESRFIISTIRQRITAMDTYVTSSLFVSSFVSSTMADMLDRKH